MMPVAVATLVGVADLGTTEPRVRRGVDINITMGLLSFGDLLIDVQGGRGGNGASGGDGGHGTRGSCSRNCRGGRGGDGGRGGNAGAGGDGGNISIAYWLPSVGPAVVEPVEGLNFVAMTQGGSAGNPGRGGRFGRGGGSSGTCGVWPAEWRRGGGGSGRPGGGGSSALPDEKEPQLWFLVRPHDACRLMCRRKAIPSWQLCRPRAMLPFCLYGRL